MPTYKTTIELPVEVEYTTSDGEVLLESIILCDGDALRPGKAKDLPNFDLKRVLNRNLIASLVGEVELHDPTDE
jgi:hypothetical protein